MLHKNVQSSARSGFNVSSEVSTQDPQQNPSTSGRLTLVSSGSGGTPKPQAVRTGLIDLVAISAHRCSSFFAEAAVLVLVLALLDEFIAKGRLQTGWIIAAFSISLGLLFASIATDFTAKRWLRAH